jgi:hypothetical protein
VRITETIKTSTEHPDRSTRGGAERMLWPYGVGSGVESRDRLDTPIRREPEATSLWRRMGRAYALGVFRKTICVYSRTNAASEPPITPVMAATARVTPIRGLE